MKKEPKLQVIKLQPLADEAVAYILQLPSGVSLFVSIEKTDDMAVYPVSEKAIQIVSEPPLPKRNRK